MNYWKIEFKKNQKKYLYFTVFSVFGVIIFFLLNNFMENNNETYKVDYLKSTISEVERVLTEIPHLGLPEDRMRAALESEEAAKILLEQRLMYFENNNWRDYVRTEIQIDEMFVEGIESGNIVGGEPVPYVEHRISLNKELLARDIEPIDENYSTKGFNFLKNTLTIVFGYGGGILILLLIGDNLARELDRGTIKILFTQPISRVKILNTKFIVAFLSTLSLIIIMILVPLIIGSLFNELGSLNYPVLQYNEDIYFSNIGTHLLKSGLLFVSVLIFLILLTSLIALLSGNSTFTISIVIVLASVFVFSFSNYGFLSNYAHWVPFIYIDSTNVVDGYLSTKLENSNVNLITGIIVTSISSLLLYIVNVYLISKKELL